MPRISVPSIEISRTVKLTKSPREISAPLNAVDHSDLRVGYAVRRINPRGSEYEVIKTIPSGVATAEVVCLAEPTGTPNEYLLRITGRPDPILLKLDHALETVPERPPSIRRTRKVTPRPR